MKEIIAVCAVIIAGIALYFLWQDRADREARAKAEIWQDYDRVIRDLNKANGWRN